MYVPARGDRVLYGGTADTNRATVLLVTPAGQVALSPDYGQPTTVPLAIVRPAPARRSLIMA